MARTQGSSDPLPYTEVDRSAKAKAARLAGAIGIPYPHALGTLIEWWDLNGTPREIERLIAEGKDEVVLPADVLLRRFEIASAGKPCAIAVLLDLELLEDQGDGNYRVRGMSRFFEPIRKRMKNRASASKGGKASVDVRKDRLGSARPASKIASVHEAPAEAIAQANVNPSDQRSAISDQRPEINDNDLFPEVVPIKPPRELSDHEVWHGDFLVHRERRLKGLELPPEVLAATEEGITLAFINVVGSKVKRWFLDNIPGLGEFSDDMSDLQVSLIDAYLELSWPASKSPPYPFRMFASEKVWEPLALALAQRHAQESLQ